MPSSTVHPDDYVKKIRNTRAEVVVIGRGQFTAEITRIDLHRLWMQRFSENLPRVGHSAGTSGPRGVAPVSLGRPRVKVL